MKIARFRHEDRIYFGQVEERQLKIMAGDIFGDFKPTDDLIAISEVKLLTPVSPSKIVCVGQNYRGMGISHQLIEFGTDLVLNKQNKGKAR